jgi:uncharacterized membrane protein
VLFSGPEVILLSDNAYLLEIMKVILHITVLLLLPALVLYLQERVRLIRWLSPIVVCYIIGIVAGNLSFVTLDNKLLRTVAEVSVCLATPMLLFSCDFLKWLRNSRTSFLSFFLGMLAVVIVSCIAFIVFRDRINEAWKVAGMAVGLYTGATVNLTAIGIALDADEKTFIVMNSADLLFGGIYFLFLITLGKKTIGLFLPGFKGYNGHIDSADGNKEPELKTPLKKRATAEIALSLAISTAILAFAFGLSMLFSKEASSTLIILVITTCGIILSFNKKINRLKYNYETGDYLLLMFALALGGMASYAELVSGNLPLVLFVASVVFGSVVLHLLLAYFFRLEDDTVIITSAAVIFGPAFILPVAGAIKNREVIVAGLSLALLGNALGTYLGIGLAYLLNYLF